MNKRAAILIIVLCVVVVTVVLACSIFAVGEVRTVTTADITLSEELSEGIVQASGIKKGGSIFSIDENAVRSNVEAAYPNVKVITVERSFPGTVSINCMLRTSFIAVPTAGGQFALMDRELKILSVADAVPQGEYIEIGGYTLIGAEEGAFADIPWLSDIIAGGDSNYLVDVRLAYFLQSVTYYDADSPYLDMLTNTGAHLLIYAEGDMDYMFSAVYQGYLLEAMLNQNFAMAERGWFYPAADGEGRVDIKYSLEFPFPNSPL